MPIGRWTILTAALVAVGSLCDLGVAAVAEPVTIKTDRGAVVGDATDGVASFKGVPYAAAPVGRRRWAPPVAVNPWSTPRPANAFGPICPQPLNANGTPNAGGATGASSEDCLFLNVWAPANDAKAKGKAPVMVWLHGGGNTMGAGSLGAYDGAAFARDGVILVTLNYRLGALGFFAHPAITKAAGPKEPLINYGIMDQIAALKWVKANIAAFGGDPDNVTLFGESAGGQDTLILMTAPSAEGLFAKAIVESGGGWSPPATLATREAEGQAIAAEVGAPAGATLAQLRSIPADAFTALSPSNSGPAVDGRLLRQTIAQAFADDQFAHVPLIIGSNSYEASLLHLSKASPETVLSMVPTAVKPAYADLPDDTAKARAMFTDSVMGAPARWIAGRAWTDPAWLYHFAYVVDAQRDHTPGAGHASEIPFVFASWDHLGAVGLGIKPSSNDLFITKMIHGCWVSFAFDGVPTCPYAPAWPTYGDKSDVLMEFDRSASNKPHFRSPQYAAQQAAILPTLQLPSPKPDQAPPPLPIKAD